MLITTTDSLRIIEHIKSSSIAFYFAVSKFNFRECNFLALFHKDFVSHYLRRVYFSSSALFCPTLYAMSANDNANEFISLIKFTLHLLGTKFVPN